MPSRIDNAALRKLGREFARLAADSPKEIQRAVGTIRRNANTEARQAIAGGKGKGAYNITQTRVQKDLDVKSGDLKVTITGDPRPINAARFTGTRKLKNGLRLQPIRGGRVGILKKGFIAKNKRYAAERVDKPRLPIESVQGPSVADMLLNPKVEVPLTTALIGRAEAELISRLARLKGT